MHSPHRAIFRRRRPGSGSNTLEVDNNDEEGGDGNGDEDDGGAGEGEASGADDGPGLVDEHGIALRPGLMTNKATWDRCGGLPPTRGVCQGPVRPWDEGRMPPPLSGSGASMGRRAESPPSGELAWDGFVAAVSSGDLII